MFIDVSYLISFQQCLYLSEPEREEIIVVLFFLCHGSIHVQLKLRNVAILVVLFILLFSKKSRALFLRGI